jgi:hypothetical protein
MTQEQVKEFNIKDFAINIQELYEEIVKNGYEEIVNNLLKQTEGVVDIGKKKKPPYAIGSLNDDGFPVQPKIVNAMKRILNGSAWINVFEGGVRGGKDVWAIYFYTEYLMHCSSQKHLVLGVSLEHALLTVLQSNGFGLLYTIPHGQFIRSSVDGAQRGVYKFLDSYGVEKEIHFYGNYKQDDFKKFQGFTFGSVYLNEGTNQHLNGINEAMQRTSASKDRLIIITQNPKGQANRFYTEFEKPFLLTEKEIQFIESVQNNEYVVSLYRQYEDKVLFERKKAEIYLKESYCKQNGVANYNGLNDEQKIFFQKSIRDIREDYENILNDATVQKFLPITDSHKFWDKSMRKILMYERGDENPNFITSGYDYNYFHFTIEDNLGMTSMMKSDFKSKYAKGSSTYAQRIDGIHKTTDSAVYSMFTNDNIFGGEVNDFDTTKTSRIMAVDKGLNHPNGIIDCEVDYEHGVVWQLGESLLDFRDENTDNQGLESVYLDILKVIRSRRNREMPDFILVDPSAIELYMYLQQRGLPVRKANNAVFTVRGDEKTEMIKIQDKDLIGIPLVQTAISKKKYMVHESCIETIRQIESYEAPFDEKAGKEKVVKVNDDLVDPIRYVFNTIIRMGMWEGDTESGEKQKDGELLGNEATQDSQRNLAREVAEVLNFGYTDEEDEYSTFWSSDGSFFNN